MIVSEYQVVLDWNKNSVLELAAHNELHGVFTVPFYTGSVNDVPYWSDIEDYPYHRLVNPIYVGNFLNAEVAIKEILSIMFGEDSIEV